MLALDLGKGQRKGEIQGGKRLPKQQNQLSLCKRGLTGVRKKI